MFAKSAPQLLQRFFPGRATLRVRRMLVMAALVSLSAGAGWLVDAREAEAQRVASFVQRQAAIDPQADPSATSAQAELSADESRHQALSEFLSRRYKVSKAVTLDVVTIAHAAGEEIGLDPLLIIAVMAVESRFNPVAQSVAGAKGLMQVIPRFHTAKFREFGGVKSVFEPEANILVGSQILKEYVKRTGSLRNGLQKYVGSMDDESSTYTGKVMTEKQRLQQVVRKTVRRPAPAIEASAGPQRLAMATP
jgi:soluble lytic murein transglycosylase-like protein